jgi:hypothetical protein
MLTLESKFSDYFKLVMSIACSDAVKQYEGIVTKDDTLTIAQVFKDFNDDPNLNEGWCEWALCTVGKELGEDVRTMIINRIKDPMMCLQLLTKCDFLTEAEHTLLKAKYAGKLPTAEKEIATGKVVLMSAKVAP